jgi:RNA polymerase sigma factor (sigma-70 family)
VDEFAEVAGPLRREILTHCYRMVGSTADAEDAVQETFVRAWRGFDRFEGRSSMRTWLHQIATNVCLRFLEQRKRRALPSGLGSASADWLSRARLAFVAALQHLPPRQRAALRLPLAPGARMVVFGSGAELRGSPLSGGYAGAKAAVRLITGYAGGLGLQATTVLPLITPGTAVGETAIEAYGVSAGVGPEEFRAGLTSHASPEFAGQTIVALADAPELSPVYLLDASGLHPLDR